MIRFWDSLQQLVDLDEIVIDRPAQSRHPRYPDIIYPFDYGYLTETGGGDGAEQDVWRYSAEATAVTGIISTVDTLKGHCEIKILLGFDRDSAEIILRFHNQGQQSAILQMRG